MKDLSHIIKGCQKNDRACQEKLYREFYPALFVLCKNFFADPHQALTALNNGMLKVFKNIERYDASKGEFFNWVYTIVRHSALTQLRDQKSVPTIEIEPRHSEMLHETQDGDDASFNIADYLDKLPPSTRVVCNLFYIEDLSLKEITQSLGMKEGTVKWHLNEGRTKLKSLVIPNISTGERK